MLWFAAAPRGALGFLLGLDALPGALDAGRLNVAILVGKDMRMTADHLARDRFHYVAEGKSILLLRHPRVINHLQQEIAELVPEIVEIAARDGVGDLIGLLDSVGRDRLKILLEVPGAAGHWRAQLRHDLDQA